MAASAWIYAAALLSACGSQTSVLPTAPSPAVIASDPRPLVSAALNSPQVTEAFSIDLPMAVGDAANGSGGLNPFGVHLADHDLDGHPGWDIEFRIGALVRAAADGTIQTVTVPDRQRPTRHVVQVLHLAGAKSYRTVYFGVDNPLPEIVVGASIRRGDPIGAAGVLTQMIGTGPITSAGIHFQVDDFSYSGGLTNFSAVNPELWLTPAGAALFAPIWAGASYTGELTEPFPSNPRDQPFPVTRRWSRASGDLTEVIELTRASGKSTDYAYRLLDAAGHTVDVGTARVTAWTRPFTNIDLHSSAGLPTRLGLYDVVSNSMRLVLGAPGASRPTSFAGATTYVTIGSSSM